MLHNNSTKDHPTGLLQAFFFRTDARNQIRFGHELRENICLVGEVETVEIARKYHTENDTHRHNDRYECVLHLCVVIHLAVNSCLDW